MHSTDLDDRAIANPRATTAGTDAALPSARALYFDLLAAPGEHAAQAERFLRAQLAAVRPVPSDLPLEPAALAGWIAANNEAVGRAYADYLAARKGGAGRQYFPTKSHALYFLNAAAPTKLVDGSWLYSVLAQWQHPQFHGLIRTYLEELGDGVPVKNHVVVYQKLLATHDCATWDDLDDDFFVQGAIQLCLAQRGAALLPEVIGFNLGYEQLPLHLLICAYELDELGIDPYYFTLHVTIDNAANGHARKAAQALTQLAPVLGDSADFLRRVAEGYRLNDLGASTLSMIEGFDLDEEVLRLLKAKSVFGKNMHSDYCRVEGRAINAWLADPSQMRDFLAALERTGWIRRGAPPEQSRFWGLIHGERAQMFGVFSAYEQQVLCDWIASAAAPARGLSHRAQVRKLEQLGVAEARPPGAPRGLIRQRGVVKGGGGDEQGELALLERRIAAMGSKAEAMQALIPLMAPETHHTPVGLMATRMYASLLAT